MRGIKMAAAMPVAAALAFAAPAAATTSVTATVTGFQSTTQIRIIAVNPSPPTTQRTAVGGRITLTSSGSTTPYTFLGGSLAGQFVAFCIEPMVTLQQTATTYTVVPLSQAASSLGGISDTKVNRIRELFAREAPTGGFAAMTSAQGDALQLAIWEIVMETGNSLAVSSLNQNRGSFYANPNFVSPTSTAASAAITAANAMLGRLNGTSPLADGLFALRNGALGEPGTQDLLVFATVAAPPPPTTAVPEPTSWAMLIAGFGLVGAALRRRRAAVTSAA